MIRWVITKHKYNDYMYMFDLRDFCVKQMRDMETNIAYLTTTLTPSKAFFKDVKKKVKEKGIKFKDRWVRYFTTEMEVISFTGLIEVIQFYAVEQTTLLY